MVLELLKVYLKWRMYRHEEGGFTARDITSINFVNEREEKA